MKTVLVTGGARGIGRAIAMSFAKAGYQVYINYHTSQKEAEALKNELASLSYPVVIHSADITKEAEVNAMIEDCLHHFGTIDVVINNAGISSNRIFTEITEQEMREMLDTNIMGAFFVTKACLVHSMLPRKEGCVINISSIWGITGASCEVHYSISKAGMIGMTKALAKELAPSHIRVNAIAPGCIQTDMLNCFSKEEREDLCEQIPLERLGVPEDISELAVFLASEQANYITGQVISPNGGAVI